MMTIYRYLIHNSLPYEAYDETDVYSEKQLSREEFNNLCRKAIRRNNDRDFWISPDELVELLIEKFPDIFFRLQPEQIFCTE